MFEIVQLSRVVLFMPERGVDVCTGAHGPWAPGPRISLVRVIVFIVRSR